jgi:hypothetical protein
MKRDSNPDKTLRQALLLCYNSQNRLQYRTFEEQKHS